MSHDVLMPQLGMAQDSATIVSWHKQVGDAVSEGDLLMEVETDKAVMEIEARHDGTLIEVLFEAGSDAEVGAVIARIGAEGDAKTAPSTESTEPAQTPEKTAVTEPAPVDAPAIAATAPPPVPAPVNGTQVLSSPKAKRLAYERGIDLQMLANTGAAQPILSHLVPTQMPASTAVMAATGLTLNAKVKAKAFEDFAKWFAEEQDASRAQLFSAFAAAAMGGMCSVNYLSPTTNENWLGTGKTLLDMTPTDQSASMAVVDLIGTALTDVSLQTDGFVVTQKGKHLRIELKTKHQDMGLAIAQLDAFALRLQNPLDHLV